MEVRENTSAKPAAARGGDDVVRTDSPLPIAPPVPEIADSPRVRASEDRLISGIDLIDFGVGGLLPGHAYLVKGSGGVGKTVVGLQFLTRGLEYEEPGLLITDQKPEKVLAQAKSIGFPIEEAVRRQQLSILNPSTRYFDLVESPADVMAIVQELGDYINQIGAKRLVIDPIYTLINTSYSAHFAMSLTQSLMNALEDLPITILMLAGGEEDAERNALLRQLEQNAFGVISLGNDAVTGGRVMNLSNLRYASCDNMTAHYRILNGRGLINYKSDGKERVADVTRAWDESDEVNRSVLLVGANADTVKRVKEALGDTYQVNAEADPKTGVERAKRERHGLVMVSPSRSAGAVNAVIELAQNASSSVAFLSPASNRQSDKVLYLSAGADDFIAEPFSAPELRARVEALVRRSGRRLNMRCSIGTITSDELSSLSVAPDAVAKKKQRPVMRGSKGSYAFEREFGDRLQRNVDTVAKFDTPFALYWIKSHNGNRELSNNLAKLCRQEDIICHNRDGEFVALLTATDENGVKGFENRLNEKLGDALSANKVDRGYRLHAPGQPTERFAESALGS